MTLHNLLVATAVLGAVFGLGYLLVPEPIMQLFGTHTDASGYLAARFFGGACLGLGIIAWLARERGGNVAEEVVVPGFTVVFLLGLVLAALGTFSGLFSSVGWLVVLIFLGFAAAFAYFQFGNPASRR
jgi:Na+-driven multidrug efflux pump